MTRAVAVFVLVVAFAACGSGDDGAKSSPAVPSTRQFTIANLADHATCVASARAIEAAANLHYATTGSYGSVADLVAGGFIKPAPNPAWGLVVGPDGTVDDSTCP